MFDSSEPSTAASKYAMLYMSAIATLALIAFALSSYLTWVTWQSASVLGCTGDSPVNCDLVLSSHWSKWMGLPVSLFGVLVYGTILAISWPASKQPLGIAGTCLLALSQLAAGAAIWFALVQAIFIGSYCPFCMSVHACGLVIALLTFFQLRSIPAEVDYQQMGSLFGVTQTEDSLNQAGNSPSAAWVRPLIAAGIASVGIVILMAGQLLFAPETLLVETFDETPSEVFEEEEPEEFSFAPATSVPASTTELTPDISPIETPAGTTSRFVSVKGLQKPIDITKYPILGNPEAPQVFVEMLDYTCTHCRHMHQFIQAALDRYGDQIAIVVYHVPLSKRCNPHIKRDYPGKGKACEYTRLAIGIAKLAPEKFPEFHNWLMESEKTPSAGSARRKAIELVGEELFLDDQLRTETTQAIINHCNTFHDTKASLPMLLTDAGVIRGIPKEESEWFKVLEETFGLKPTL